MLAIREVTLHNFRGFERLEKLRLAPLTFLVGPNSSGKSSVADAILFMAQSGFLSLEATSPLWVGPLVDLGSFKDTVFRHETSRAIEIGVQIAEEPLTLQRSNRAFVRRLAARAGKPIRDPMNVEVGALVKATKSAPEGQLKRLRIQSGVAGSAELVRRAGRSELFDARAGDRQAKYDPQPWNTPARVLLSMLDPSVTVPPFFDFAASVQRVSSARKPPQRTYPRDGGSAGDQARRLLDGIDATALEGERRPDLRSALVRGLVALGIADELDVARLSDYHTAVHLRDNVTGVVSNLAELGYGASQVLPVLEGCAAPGPGPLFVEQPEIHLHPRAQGELSQILCDASRKRQMIVETHSEHMVNRARRLVAEGTMKPEDIVIQYIDRDEGGSHAVAIGLDDAGDFTRDWPGGFFDERYRETMKIAEAQAKKAAE
jgi:hypothetical protein